VGKAISGFEGWSNRSGICSAAVAGGLVAGGVVGNKLLGIRGYGGFLVKLFTWKS
jgi:hypothetical protein